MGPAPDTDSRGQSPAQGPSSLWPAHSPASAHTTWMQACVSGSTHLFSGLLAPESVSHEAPPKQSGHGPWLWLGELVLVTQRLAQTLGHSTGRLGCGGGWDCGWWLPPPSGHEKRNDQKFGPGICESRGGLHLTQDFWGRVRVTPGELCHCS